MHNINYTFYSIAKLYAHLYVLVKAITGSNIPGLGFLLRRCKSPQYIDFLDQKLYFAPAVSASYGLHIINHVHEPETHKFLNELFDAFCNIDSSFIEIGANVGVFMVDLSRRSNVHVYGFEPSDVCVEAIKKSMAKNHRVNFTVYQNLVGDRAELFPFSVGKDAQGASIYTSTQSTTKVQQVKLDDVEQLNLLPDTAPVVLMIDVEGYEPNVLRGGRELIKRLKPLVLFEYNFVSKRYFDINTIYEILGDTYTIYRLRKDAMLDSDVENAWNCVAIARNSQFDALLKSRIVG